MQSQLAKSLYLGLAALSFGAVATAAATTTSADAAAKAKIVSKSALGKDSKNVEVTGTNAIYTKPGTVRGAKLVASKKTVKKLANSNHSKDYFRAYHMAVTNRGTVYYKIVSMNGKYRGYIYGGKVKGTIGAGIKEAQTVKEATMPTRTAGFHIKNVKKNTLWTAPQHTTYKAHKVNMYGTTKEDTFTVSKAETKTKEGSLYYYVTSDKNSDVAGWIFAGEGYKDATSVDFGGLTINEEEPAATNDNSVKIVYREAGKQVGDATWITTAKDAKAGKKVTATDKNTATLSLEKFASNKIPSGYKLQTKDAITTATSNATYGNNVYVDVVSAATSKISLAVENVTSTVGGNNVTVANPLKSSDKLTVDDFAVTLKADAISALSGDKSQVISTSELDKIAAGFGTDMEGTKTYYAGAQAYHYKFSVNVDGFKSDNRQAKYGDTLTAKFNAVLVSGAAEKHTVDSSWIAQ